MTLTDSGNLLVGTTTDAGFKLDVNGTGRFSGNITTSASVSGSGSFGTVSSTWAGGSFPTLFSSNNDRWIMHINPHISYTQNGVNGFAGAMTGATIRLASDPAATTYWDAGIGTNSVGTDKFSIGRAGTNILSITAGGNVGIGTFSPTTYSLAGRHLELNDAGGGYAFIHNNTTSVKSFYASNESAGVSVLYTFSNHPLLFGTNNTERMRITSTGNVGIGVSPSSWDTGNTVKALEISQGAFWGYSTTNVYLASNYYWSGSNRIYLKSAAAAEYSITNGAHEWYTASSGTAGNAVTLNSVMRITSGGNVLIGTTTDVGARLHVNGGIRTGAPSGGSAVDWRLGTARAGTITPNAIVRVEINGVLVDLDARYV